MIRRTVIVVWLAAVWVALWGELSAANVLSGVAVSIAALVPFELDRPEPRGGFRPLRALHYLAFFAKTLAVSNAVVAWEVLTPTNREDDGIIEVPLARSCNATLLTTIVNSIGLAPGSMVVDICSDRTRMYVHVLHLGDPDASRRSLMRLQELAIRAFGSTEAIAEVDELVGAASRAVES